MSEASHGPDPDFSVLQAEIVTITDVMSRAFPGAYPNQIRQQAQRGLQILWAHLSEVERREISKRLREGDSLAVLDELMAAAALAAAFGDTAIKVPSVSPGQVKPEFFVEMGTARCGVECRRLMDSERIRMLNELALENGTGWLDTADPDHQMQRFHRAIVSKIVKRQGGDVGLIVLSSQTPWLGATEMDHVVRLILQQPAQFRLNPESLPIGIVCLIITVLQGVWFNLPRCDAAGLTREVREQIRRAFSDGYVHRSDGVFLTEEAWPPASEHSTEESGD